MSISHEEARRLIEFRADDALEENESNVLKTHLNSCPDCQIYANRINELSATLQPLLQRRWNQSPLPLSNRQASSGRSNKLTQDIFFATRIAALSVICIAFLFNIWQYTQPGRQRTGQPSAEIPMIPTPSMQSTVTKDVDQNCDPLLHQVRENDTLESIADQFSIPPEEIIRVNRLRTSTLDKSMKLAIPVCRATPSGVQNRVRTTFTPLLGATSLTPIIAPTQ